MEQKHWREVPNYVYSWYSNDIRMQNQYVLQVYITTEAKTKA